MIAVIPAKAGIQKRDQFFVTLHNTSLGKRPTRHSRTQTPVGGKVFVVLSNIS